MNEREVPSLKQLCFNYLIRNHDEMMKNKHELYKIYNVKDIREEFISMSKRKNLVDDIFFSIFSHIFILSNSNIVNDIESIINPFKDHSNNSNNNNNNQIDNDIDQGNDVKMSNTGSTAGSGSVISYHHDDNDNGSGGQQSVTFQPLSSLSNNNSLETELKYNRNIDLSMLPKITDYSIQLISVYSNLQNLDLSYCTGLSFDFIKHLSSNEQIKLQYLNLYYTNINDVTLSTIASRYPDIKSLLLGGCNNISDSGIKSILKLSKLQHLDLSYCKKITASGIKTIALPELQYFNASWCFEVPVSDSTYFRVVKGCPKLTSLYIAASNISEYQLIKILSERKNMTNLDISYCTSAIPSVESKVLKSISELKVLSLAGCQFREPIIKKIFENSPKLLSIDLSHQDTLSWALIESLVKDNQLSNLHLINFSFSKFNVFDPEIFSKFDKLTVYSPLL